MRKRAIAKIIACSIIGMILTGILLAGTAAALSGHVTGISGRFIQSFLDEGEFLRKAAESTERAFKRLPVPKLHFFGCAPVITFSDNDISLLPSSGTVKSGYTLGNASYEGKADSVSIDWAAGRIIISTHENESGIFLYEYSGTDDRELSTDLKDEEFSEREQMMHRLSGGTLKIEEYPESIVWPNGQATIKTLVVLLPKSAIREIDIDAAAASVDLIGLEAGELELDCASSDIRVSDSTINKLDIDCAAANGEFTSCRFGSIDIDSAGAKLTFELLNTPDKIDIDGMAGSYRLVLPSDASFSVKADSLAAAVNISGFQTSVSNGRTVVNGGSSKFDFSLVSGSVTIEAAKSAHEGTSF